MYSRYVPNKLLIAHKSRLLFLPTMLTPFVIKLVPEVYGLFQRVSFSEEMTEGFWLVGL